MNKSYLALIPIFAATYLLLTLSDQRNLESNYRSAFQTWKINFLKKYNSQFQENYRFIIFKNNLLMINHHNAKYQSKEVFSTLRLNQFSDLTTEEFKKSYLSELPSKDSSEDFSCEGPQYPKRSTFDSNFISNIGKLTPVNTQGQCASGYAFATVAAAEALMDKIEQFFFAFSAQLLVDCSKQTGNNGCEGGSAFNSLHYLANKGAIKASDYPYKSQVGDCKYETAKKVWDISTCTKVDPDLEMLKSQIYELPVIVGFEASDTQFIHHSSGLYVPSKCGTKINHYMLAIGWGQETTGTTVKVTNYYILVKNSFGVGWGDSGYAKIVVQKEKTPNNACGMLTDMHFPYA